MKVIKKVVAALMVLGALAALTVGVVLKPGRKGIYEFSGLCGQSPDFAEISGFYKIPFHHPASTAAEDLVTGKILR